MTLEALKNADKVIGIKQVTKAVNKGLATCVFLAGDADARVIEPLRTLCAEKGIETVPAADMQELGEACALEVGAAAAAVLR